MFFPNVQLQVLDSAEMEAIYLAAQRILASVRLQADGTAEFYDLVRAVGCDVDRGTVGFPQPVIEQLLQRLERSSQFQVELHP